MAELGSGTASTSSASGATSRASCGSCDLSLLPSWDEPFANVMLESMAMGTPLLVSSVGGGPELVEDGVTGRVLPPRQPEAWATAARELLATPSGWRTWAKARAGNGQIQRRPPCT